MGAGMDGQVSHSSVTPQCDPNSSFLRELGTRIMSAAQRWTVIVVLLYIFCAFVRHGLLDTSPLSSIITVAFPFELIVADTVNVAAELDVDSVDVNDKSENNGTVVLNPLVAGCTAVVDIIIFCPALV